MVMLIINIPMIMLFILTISAYYLCKDEESIIFSLLFIILEKDKRIDFFLYKLRIKLAISCLTWLTLIELESF